MASRISKPVRTALHQAWRRLQAWAADPRAFEVVLGQAFGTPAAAAQALRRDLLGRQWAIPLEVSTDPALTGVQAAYIAAAAHGGERIIVNGAWAASVGTAALEAVILEEIGHAIDRRLHGDADSRGDEGEIFSALVRGASPSARAAHERDQRTLVLAGTPVTVEASAVSVWTRLAGSSRGDGALGVAAAADGSVTITGAGEVNPALYSTLRASAYEGLLNSYAGSTGSSIRSITLTDAGTGTTPPDVQGQGVVVAADGSVVVAGQTSVNGSFRTQGFLSRYGADGSLSWSRLLQPAEGVAADTEALAVALAADGSILVTGRTAGTFGTYNTAGTLVPSDNPNQGSTDIFLARYSATGSLTWVRQFGTPSADAAQAVAVAADGSIYIGGYTYGSLDGQTPSWPARVPPGGATPVGPHDAFITKYRADGLRLWTRLFSASTHNAVNALAVAADGSVVATGDSTDFSSLRDAGVEFFGSGLGFLSRMLADGSPSWQVGLGSDSGARSRGLGLVAATDGYLYVSGSTTAATFHGQASNGGTDAFVSQVTTAGSRVWSQLIGTAGSDNGRAVAYGGGFLYLAGDTTGNLNGVANAGGTSGTADAFVTRLDVGSSSSAGPQVSSLSVNLGQLTITLDRVLGAAAPGTGRFSVLVNGLPRGIGTVTVAAAARTVTLSLASAVSAADSVTLAYTDLSDFDDASGVVQDAAGLDLASFAARSVTNLTDGTPPAVTSQEVNGQALTLTTNEPLATTVPALDRFRVLVNGIERPVLAATIGSGSGFGTVGLQLASAVLSTDVVTLTYTDLSAANDSSGVVEDQASNDLASFGPLAVTNLTPALPPLAVSSLSVNAASLTLTLNQAIADTLPALDRFAVAVNGSPRSLAGAVINGERSVTLELASPVAAADGVTLAYTDLSAANDSTGVIEDSAGTDLASFGPQAVSNLTPAPLVLSLSRVSVNGAEMTLEFNKPLAATVPAAARFSVLVNGAARTVGTATLDSLAAVVTLPLSSAVNAGDGVTLAYTDLSGANDSSNVIEDSGGTDLASVGPQSALNFTPAVPAPSVTGLSISSASLTLRFNETLAATVPALARWEVTVNGAARTVTGVSVNGAARTVTLTLASAVTASQAVLVTYRDLSTANDASGVVQNLAGADLGDMISRPVDTFISAVAVTSLNAAYRSLQLTGTGAIAGNGTAGDNRIIGNSGANTLNGAAGDDQLRGEAGNDVLIGGAGTNRLDGGAGIDTASYAASAAAVAVSLAVSDPQNTLGAGIDTLLAIENLTGSAFNDVLTGNAGANALNGGAGGDDLAGGAGNDTYVVDNAGDVVVEFINGGVDLVQSSITWVLSNNGVENLTLTGSAAIRGTGNPLANVITGNGGANLLSGRGGNDTLLGGGGNDTLGGGAGNARLDGGAGTDTASYSAAATAVTVSLAVTTAQATGDGSDTLLAVECLTGSAFNDQLSGNTLANQLDGGAGNDTLSGGTGADQLSGGAGNDCFRWAALNESLLSGIDRIIGLQIGVDSLDGPSAVTAAALQELGAAASLAAADLTTLLSPALLPAGGAATFTYQAPAAGSPLRTFLALNDSTAGFNSSSDALIELTGYSGSLTALAVG
ncbi:MAG: beta strand repeat-containing protein [Cyanobacteriota bacterium]